MITDVDVSNFLWRECANWLVRAGVLDPAHKVFCDDATPFDFGSTLRDGFILCRLANALCKGSVEMHDVNSRPQMSQFLCLKNISLFLDACTNSFGIPSASLFDASELFKLTDFAKVLDVLSQLSKTPVALRSGIRGFPDENEEDERVYVNCEEVYKNLADLAEDVEVEEPDENYGRVDDAEGDRVYGRAFAAEPVVAPPEFKDFVPQSQRDYIIRELLETEQKYVALLMKLVRDYYQPLKNALTPSDHDLIFSNLAELREIHTGFQSELIQTFRQANLPSSPAHSDASPSTTGGFYGDVFLRWKMKFTAYSTYCSSLDSARVRLQELRRDPSSPVVVAINKCRFDTRTKEDFSLEELLQVPFQRVLKYPLLLRELVKHTARGHPEYESTRQAHDAMADVSAFLNEAKRDREQLATISAIERSITNFELFVGTRLSDYGRLLKDGELKCEDHKDRRVRPRNVFIFDKVVLICKVIKGSGILYSYKAAILLSDYRLEDADSNNNKSKLPIKVQTMFICSDNSDPSGNKLTDHKFVMHSFDEPTECTKCHKLLKGVFFQGYRCFNCAAAVHKDCTAYLCGCPGQGLRLGRPKSDPGQWATFAQGDLMLYRCIRDFNGNGAGPEYLSIREGNLVQLLDNQTGLDGYWKGRIFEKDRIGLFPQECVRRSRLPTMLRDRTTWHRETSTVTLRDSNGRGTVDSVFPAGPSYVNLTELEHHPWFAGPIAREVADHILDGLPDGSFLVRYSEKQGRHALSVSFHSTTPTSPSPTPSPGGAAASSTNGSTVKHVKIEHGLEGFYIDTNRYFGSIVELVKYYQEHNLQESFQSLDTKLLCPWRLAFMGYAVALYRFDATQPNTLSIEKGQVVMILNKVGEENGWWKGKVNGKTGYFPMAYVEEMPPASESPIPNELLQHIQAFSLAG